MTVLQLNYCRHKANHQTKKKIIKTWMSDMAVFVNFIGVKKGEMVFVSGIIEVAPQPPTVSGLEQNPFACTECLW